MKPLLILFVVCVLITACVPAPIADAQAPLPTYTFYPTHTPYPTYTPYPTPVNSAIEVEVNEELTAEKEMGVWLVDIEIAPGMWRSSGDCWSTVFYDKNKNDFHTEIGNKHIISIPSDAFSVQFGGMAGSCTWSYMGE